MHHPRRPWSCLVFALALLPLAPAAAQDVTPLRVSGFSPAGLRNSLSEKWSAMTFSVTNFGPTPRDVRVVVSYEGEPFDGYARDLTVPGNSIVQSWVAVGPAPKAGNPQSRTIQMVLYDRTGGTPVVVRPATEERTRDRATLYRPNDAGMALYADVPVDEDRTSFRQPTPLDEALSAVRVMRSVRNLSGRVTLMENQTLPTQPEAFAGTELIILANNRLTADPLGRAAIRRWVEQGGNVWVMLDQVDPDVVGALLGDEFVPHVVDRTSIQQLPLERFKAVGGAKTGLPVLERPVPFVRVLLSGREDVIHYIDAWPASFSQRLGRGKVLFTTLGPAGWYRPRVANKAPTGRGMMLAGGDPPSPYDEVPDLPVATDSMHELIGELKPVDHPFTTEDLRGPLTDEIGYAVPGRMPVATILAAFVASLIGIAVVIRRSRRTEVVGWLIPAAAVVAGGLFVTFGRQSRHAIPPTVAIAETVEAIPATGEVSRRGLFATYQPDSGPAPVAAPRGGMLDLNFDGLDGQPRLHLQTDQEAWRFDNLSLPAGVRDGAFRATDAIALSAVASFGPDGLQGRLQSGSFHDPADALVVTRGRTSNGVRMAADGTFSSGPAEALTAGQFLNGAVLTDRQQRRQTVYTKLLSPAPPPHWGGRDYLLAWATPTDVPFTVGEARATGTSLLVVPIDYQPPPPGTAVRIPPAFIPYQRLVDGKLAKLMTMDSNFAIDMRMRFQLPPSVVPMTLEKAVVHVKMKAVARPVKFSHIAGDAPTPLKAVDGPTEPIRLELTDPKLLALDADGGWHFGISVGDAVNHANKLDQHWTIESISLEVEGRTAGKR